MKLHVKFKRRIRYWFLGFLEIPPQNKHFECRTLSSGTWRLADSSWADFEIDAIYPISALAVKFCMTHYIHKKLALGDNVMQCIVINSNARPFVIAEVVNPGMLGPYLDAITDDMLCRYDPVSKRFNFD